MSLMFETENQRCRVVKTIFNLLPKTKHLWNDKSSRPNEAAFQKQMPYSSGEVLIAKVAIDLWNGDGHADFGDMVLILDSRILRAVGGLLIASESSSGIEAWLKIWEK